MCTLPHNVEAWQAVWLQRPGQHGLLSKRLEEVFTQGLHPQGHGISSKTAASGSCLVGTYHHEARMKPKYQAALNVPHSVRRGQQRI